MPMALGFLLFSAGIERNQYNPSQIDASLYFDTSEYSATISAAGQLKSVA